MGPSQVLPLQVRVEVGVMPMKEYSTLPRSPLTNGIYHTHGISNLHNDFKKKVLINNNSSVLFICNFIVLFSYM